MGGALYYYFSKRIPEVPEITEKPDEGEIVKPEEVVPSPEEEKPVVQKCTDGTLYGQCSADKPKYCDNGILVNKCSTCGCPGNRLCQQNGSCLEDSFLDTGQLPIKVGILQFAPENVQYGSLYFCYDPLVGYYLQSLEEYCTNIIEQHNFLEIFNNPQGQFKFENLREIDKDNNPHSLFYMNSFFEKEAEKYGFIQKPMFKIEIRGPYTLYENPPKRGRTTGSAEEVISFFENKTREIGIDLTQYDRIVYVYFNDCVLSQRVYCGFLGFTTIGGKITYNSVDTLAVMEDSALQQIFHEITHSLGASDKYIAPCPRGNYWSCCMVPEGIPEPNKTPKYPQEKACLMCGSIALTYEGEEQNPGNLDKVVICDKTAEEIGWKTGLMNNP